MNPFQQWVQLEQPRLGTRVVFANDEFFAAKERLIDSADPIFVPDKYDANGKWMDGWESRRKRTPGNDWCIVRLGIPGLIHGVDINTSHFTGNFPPEASLEACVSDAELPADGVDWLPLLKKVKLSGDTHHWHSIEHDAPITHVRLQIYPDGGVARLRLYGEVRPDWSEIGPNTVVDLLAVENGGRALIASDEHFGSMRNLNLSGRGVNMGDGWETARRRGPGNDWVILQLGTEGVVSKLEIDTAYFKGNYPGRASIDAVCLAPDLELSPAALASADLEWRSLLPEAPLSADTQQLFEAEIANIGAITHLRLNIFPDGGVSRLRLWGTRT